MQRRAALPFTGCCWLLAGWLVGWLASCLVGLAGWLVGHLSVCLSGWLVSWLVVAGWLVGWLVGWHPAWRWRVSVFFNYILQIKSFCLMAAILGGSCSG